MNFENLLFEQKGKVGIITINNPKSLNALNPRVVADIESAFDQISKTDEISVVIITGAGKAFVAGADIVTMSTMYPTEARKWAEEAMRTFRKIELLEKPVIAAINGFALGGGCELALACDIRIASDNAKLGQPEITLGITPGFGGTQRLPRVIGAAKAKEFIFTGGMYTAEEAEKVGLLNKVVKPEELMDVALSMATRMSELPSVAMSYCKTAINRGIEVDLDTGLEIEKDLFALCFATEDQKEGMGAFVQKRKAEFKGK
ncbi:enoyl-CoA hydratase-related protein [Serpentinicella alkaliphila]|uniref:short-chain-enoyl-CoA hydratase n=1 Tax=Serpentinicella alkaliphila TaxID=1734049 RepID=A0A4V2T573_9FIRM|nr:enoyl-CoA hydratase-related protein [Serpentinicella alkaliphila]QUH26811.1 enoyl-CoA hydratase/isomerase family protein [Serpentinicella alkaliphila]TCQ08034.1 enoyl-CoA hydratase [Serpentinicella alkaliphila]